MTLDRTAFERRHATVAAEIEATLDDLLGPEPIGGEIARPARLVEAMRYAMLGGGKRLRPLLLVEAARLFGADGDGILRAAAAIELIHGYSLAHDDLPAMDDDDMRRGRPSLHRAFDEATAILAGDALLTLAFDVVADPATDPAPSIRAELVHRLARAAGPGGMVGGQVLDLAAEGRWSPDGRPLPLGAAAILRLQAMKTGALIAAAVDLGAILGRATPSERADLAGYGALVGRAFQIADDLLDVEASAEAVGKATGKDAVRGKATLVGIEGAQRLRERLAGIVDEAVGTLAPFGERADMLAEIARFVADRPK